jgi:hypothetical protein
MMEEGKREISAILFVLVIIGSFVAIMDINPSPLTSLAKCNPIQSVVIAQYLVV